jgi:hypothetical protein
VSLDLSMRFRFEDSKVVQEAFDDEVVIIHLDSGNYYSLDKVGGEIWGLIATGASVAEIVEDVSIRYDGDRPELENSVLNFLEVLQQENLLKCDVSAGTAPEPLVIDGRCVPAPDKLPFETPTLHKFTDMQDLLLLDPIHEVDDTGWPNPSPHEP